MKTQNSLFRFILFIVLFLLVQAFLVNNAYSGVAKGPKYYSSTCHILGNAKVFYRIIKVDGYGKSVAEIKDIVNKDINANYGKKKSHVSGSDKFWWTFDGYHQTAIMYGYNASTKKFGWLAMNNYFYYTKMDGKHGTLEVGESVVKTWTIDDIGGDWTLTLKFKNPKGETWDADQFIYMFGQKYR